MPKLSEIDHKSEEFMELAKRFVANPVGFFLIAGSPGVGKTFTARAIFDYLERPWHDNYFFNQGMLNAKWQEDFSRDGNVKYLLDNLIKAPLLVLDDIGDRRPSESFLEFLYLIVDQRFDHCDKRGTILTTNLTANEILELFGNRFLSRVASGHCVRIGGADRRNSKF